MSQDPGGKAIEPRSFPKESPCQHGRDQAHEAAAEDIGQIVGTDKNARPADQQCQKSEQKRATGQAVKGKRRDNGDRRRGVIGRKRPIRALGNDQVADASVVRADPVDAGVSHLIISKSPDWSFPSDHATASIAIVAAFALHGLARRTLLFGLLALLICWSRVFVGTHYLADVIGGSFTGVVAAMLVWVFYREGSRLDRFATGIL